MKIGVFVKANKTKEGVEQNGDEFTVWTKAPKKEGRANADVVRQLANYFGVTQSEISLVAGHTAKRKMFEISK